MPLIMKIDLLIKNALVYQTPTQSFAEKNIAIKEGKFYYISTDKMTDLAPEKVIDAQERYIVPGLIDNHMHIESSMVTPSIFSKAALSYGVTSVVADAHEITNVFGVKGLRYFMAAKTELDIFHAIPSSVPSTSPDIETTGGIIGVDEVAELLKEPGVICLGEAMNFHGIAYDPESTIRQIINLCKKEKPTMPLEGHCPKIVGRELADFLFSGITSDHTHQFPETLLERIEAGVFVQFQNKSITKENMAVLNDNHLYEYASIVTDDVMADELLSGHLNENLKKAVACGLPMTKAIYMTTFTPARHMGLRDRGMIAPGRVADFIMLEDLDSFTIHSVYKDGRLVHRQNEPIEFPKQLEFFPADFYQSINCRKLTAEDLAIRVATQKATVRCNVIKKHEVGTFTEHLVKEIPVENGLLQWQKAGCSLIVVMERYGKNGNVSVNLVDQPITEAGAIGTTWAHDHHNLMVMGNDVPSILKAQEKLLEIQGGYVVVEEAEIIGICPLPLGGILSQEPLQKLGDALEEVRSGMRHLGYKNMNEIMSFSTLSLPVSQAIKVTDRGMLDTKTQKFYSMVLPEDGKVIGEVLPENVF
jgi:adenine deaminase